jgi:hypothetical protein
VCDLKARFQVENVQFFGWTRMDTVLHDFDNSMFCCMLIVIEIALCNDAFFDGSLHMYPPPPNTHTHTHTHTPIIIGTSSNFHPGPCGGAKVPPTGRSNCSNPWTLAHHPSLHCGKDLRRGGACSHPSPARPIARADGFVSVCVLWVQSVHVCMHCVWGSSGLVGVDRQESYE